jgi:hypothetical protein
MTGIEYTDDVNEKPAAEPNQKTTEDSAEPEATKKPAAASNEES